MKTQAFLLQRTMLAWTVIVAAVGLTLTGCGRGPAPRVAVYPVQGKVAFQGKPTPGALIVLHPKGNPDAPPAYGQVKEDGTFTVRTYEPDDGAAPGEYVVTVEWTKPVNKNGEVVTGPNLLPPNYSQADKSGIVVQVAAQTNELPPITLKR